MQSNRKELFRQLSRTLRKIETYEGIVLAVQFCILNDYNKANSQFQHPGTYTDILLLQAITMQYRAGETTLAKGFLTMGWEKTQAQWSSDTSSHHDGPKWTNTVVKVLHTFTCDMWLARNSVLHGVT